MRFIADYRDAARQIIRPGSSRPDRSPLLQSAVAVERVASYEAGAALVAIRPESHRPAAPLIFLFQGTGGRVAINADIRFAFVEWESVRVEEIKTQPETDVVQVRKSYSTCLILCLFQILSPCADRGWTALRSLSIDVGTPKKVSLRRHRMLDAARSSILPSSVYTIRKAEDILRRFVGGVVGRG